MSGTPAAGGLPSWHVAGALRALPTLGLLTLFVLLAGIGLMPPIWALVILTVPPLLAGTYAGISSVDRNVVDAARAMGMTEWQVLFRAEFPNGLPVMYGGFRTGVLQVIATVSVVAYINLGGLGRYLFDGLVLSDFPQMLGGSLLIAGLAISRRPCPCPHSEAVPVTGRLFPARTAASRLRLISQTPYSRGLLFKEVRHEGNPPTSTRQARIRRPGRRRRPGHGIVRLRRLIRSAEHGPGHRRCHLRFRRRPW